MSALISTSKFLSESALDLFNIEHHTQKLPKSQRSQKQRYSHTHKLTKTLKKTHLSSFFDTLNIDGINLDWFFSLSHNHKIIVFKLFNLSLQEQTIHSKFKTSSLGNPTCIVMSQEYLKISLGSWVTSSNPIYSTFKKIFNVLFNKIYQGNNINHYSNGYIRTKICDEIRKLPYKYKNINTFELYVNSIEKEDIRNFNHYIYKIKQKQNLKIIL